MLLKYNISPYLGSIFFSFLPIFGKKVPAFEHQALGQIRMGRWFVRDFGLYSSLGLEELVAVLDLYKQFEPPHDKINKMPLHPAKTQISLGICPVWSESSLCAEWVAEGPSFLHADNKGSDQTGWKPRLIWVFAGRTFHFVGFVMRWLLYPLHHDWKGYAW